MALVQFDLRAGGRQMVMNPFLTAILRVRYRRTVRLLASLVRGPGTPSGSFRCDRIREVLDDLATCSSPRLLVTFRTQTSSLFSFVGMHCFFAFITARKFREQSCSIGLRGIRPPAGHQEGKPASSSLETHVKRFCVVIPRHNVHHHTIVIGKAVGGIEISTWPFYRMSEEIRSLGGDPLGSDVENPLRDEGRSKS